MISVSRYVQVQSAAMAVASQLSTSKPSGATRVVFNGSNVVFNSMQVIMGE